MISVDSVFKIFKGSVDVVALNNVSVDFKKGEITAIFGPSGSGKTSLVKCIGNIWKPTTGSIYYQDQDITKFNDKESSYYRINDVGFIFQDFNLIPSLNVLENIKLPMNLAKNKNKSEKQTRANELLDLLGISKYAKSFPDELSGGEKQRVAIAVALANNPGILLCDEPTANLDADNRKIVLDHLRSLARDEHKTVLIVSHDNEVIKYVDKVVRIDKGVITSIE